MKRGLILALCITLLWLGSLWAATAQRTSSGLCVLDSGETWPAGASPNWVEYYVMHWDSMVAYGATWSGEDSVRFVQTCYSEPIATPYELWLGAFAVHCIWYEKDTVMDGGNIGVAGDTVVSDCDSLLTTLQTSVDGSVWEDILSWTKQTDTSTVFLYMDKDSLDSYRVGQFFRLKWVFSAWDDSVSAKIDTADHLTDNKVMVHWQFEGGYKQREGTKGQ